MVNKELELKACKLFVCPNLNIIDIICKELDFENDDVAKKAKELAIEYLKKTYHKPKYSHVKFILPACVYLASILNGEHRTQSEISSVANCCTSSITKWWNDIADELDLSISL